MTPAERKAKERKAKRDAGLVPVEVWVPKDNVPDLKAWVADMASKPRVVWESKGHYTMHNLCIGEAITLNFPEPDGDPPKVITHP